MADTKAGLIPPGKIQYLVSSLVPPHVVSRRNTTPYLGDTIVLFLSLSMLVRIGLYNLYVRLQRLT